MRYYDIDRVVDVVVPVHIKARTEAAFKDEFNTLEPKEEYVGVGPNGGFKVKSRNSILKYPSGYIEAMKQVVEAVGRSLQPGTLASKSIPIEIKEAYYALSNIERANKWMTNP